MKIKTKRVKPGYQQEPCSGFFVRFVPDPVGVILGTGYSRFQHASGMAGLAKITGDRLDILAVNATNEGKGQFRQFIAAGKKSFRVVAVWEDWNPILAPALERYGFKPAQCVEAWGEINNGWEWVSCRTVLLNDRSGLGGINRPVGD